MKKAYIFITIITLMAPAYAQQNDEKILSAIVKVKSTIPGDARTARILGTEREGNGVLIDSHGHILTIGYIILEAKVIEIVNQEGEKISAQYVGYDHKTGFGLIRAEKLLEILPIRLGQSSDVKEGDPVLKRAAEAGEPILVNALRDEPELGDYMEESGVKNLILTPVMARGVLIGLLDDATRAGRPGNQEQRTGNREPNRPLGPRSQQRNARPSPRSGPK